MVKDLLNLDHKIPQICEKELRSKIDELRSYYKKALITEKELEERLQDIFYNQALVYVLESDSVKSNEQT